LPLKFKYLKPCAEAPRSDCVISLNWKEIKASVVDIKSMKADYQYALTKPPKFCLCANNNGNS